MIERFHVMRQLPPRVFPCKWFNNYRGFGIPADLLIGRQVIKQH